MAPSPTGLPPHRRRSHVPLQLAVRAAAGRRVPAADREHGHEPRGREAATAQIQELASLARARLGRRRSRSSSTGRRDVRRARRPAALRREGLRGRRCDSLPHAGRGRRSWDDIVLGRIEYPNKELDDLVILRSDGRPTYNFVSPVEDVLDSITHVLRGHDHVSNTPKQINILQRARCRPARLRARPEHQRRRRQEALEAPRRSDGRRVPERRLPACCAVNHLALLGWSYDDKTTIMSRDELIERFILDRIGASPATFDYKKLDWMNGVYLRDLQPDEYADALLTWLREQGIDWPRGSRARNGAARPGEDREVLAIPGLRPVPLRAGRPLRAASTRRSAVRRPSGWPRSSRGRPPRSRRRCAHSRTSAA